MKNIVNNGIKVCYRTEGDKANPALVMLHGFGNDSLNWYELGYVDILKQYFYLMMPDVRGYGESDKPYEPKSHLYHHIAQDILLMLDQEGVEHANLYGSSIGALEAGYLAMHHQDRFHAFVFQGTSPFHVTSFKPFLKKLLEETKSAGIKAYVDSLEQAFGAILPVGIRRAMEQCDVNALYAIVQVWPDHIDHQPTIEKPSLIIIGENEGNTQDMQQAQEDIPNCELVIIPNLDHAHAYWAGKQVAPVIIDFLSRANGQVSR